ncbi:MAG: S8 family serine peptidase [Saprospiraceae bacterium]|nr:S8 family serine peptidase [Saprospiraceae bacterium]
MVQFDWSPKIQAAVFKKWQATNGKGVKIAVLDTGLDLAHPALSQLGQPGHKLNAAAVGFDPANPHLFGNGDVADAHRKKGHGTQCTSLLSARPTATDALSGIAPAAEVFIIKVNTVDHKFFRIKDLLRGLEAAANLKVDIILVSIAYPPEDLAAEGISTAEVDRVFGLVEQSGAVLFSALPNKKDQDSWLGIAAKSFPGQRPNSINVGAVSQAMLNGRLAEIDAEAGVHFLVSNAKGVLCKISGEYVEEPISSSYATYLVGGIAALCLASQKQRTTENGGVFTANDLIKKMGQKFTQLVNAPVLDPNTPVFFKKSIENA